MAIDVHVRARELAAVDEARVIELVGKHDVTASHESADDAEVAQRSASEKQCAVGFAKLEVRPATIGFSSGASSAPAV